MGNVVGTFANCDFRNRNLGNTQYYETSFEGLYLFRKSESITNLFSSLFVMIFLLI